MKISKFQMENNNLKIKPRGGKRGKLWLKETLQMYEYAKLNSD